jgi:diguanylate cyclase
MVDIDHFKKINDTYGHDNGDVVLQKLGEILKEKARSYDMVSRWGGEEFLIICARSDNEDTFQLAERLRKAVAKTTIELQKEVTISLTISLGIASWSAEYQDAEQLLKEADNCLSQAKTNGRNRVEKRS